MDYRESLEWLSTLPRLADAPGIENTRRLLAKLGNPQDKLKFVHNAGTNGKGSATVMLASVLQQAGYKTGANISPYVLDFCERFQINGTMIAKDALAAVMTRVRTAVEELEDEGWYSIVEFDAVTATALLWYAQEQCDIVCLETGLGGRLDSTNAVQNTLVACVMCIGKDHTELLGDSLAQIAAEKCGIFKNNCAVISYPAQPQEAADEIVLRTQQANCALCVPELEDLHLYKGKPFENRINYGGYDLQVPFAGKHQAYNATVVVEAALALCEKGFEISDEAIEKGIASAAMPARIEVLRHTPLVIVDGAHNADGAKALAQTLHTAGVKNLTAIIGVVKGKQPQEMLAVLSPYLKNVYTVAPNSPRALSANELAALAKTYYANVRPCESLQQALQLAHAQCDNGLLICGSLYLAAEARPNFIS